LEAKRREAVVVEVMVLPAPVTELLLQDTTLLRVVPLPLDNSRLCLPDLPLPQITSSNRTWLKVLPTITEVPLEELRAQPDHIVDQQVDNSRALPGSQLTEVDKAQVQLDRTLDLLVVNNNKAKQVSLITVALQDHRAHLVLMVDQQEDRALQDFPIMEEPQEHKVQLDLTADQLVGNSRALPDSQLTEVDKAQVRLDRTLDLPVVNNNNKAKQVYLITVDLQDRRAHLVLMVDQQVDRALLDFPIMEVARPMLKDLPASRQLMETLLHLNPNLDLLEEEVPKTCRPLTRWQEQVRQL
jgi:hypothetical protein